VRIPVIVIASSGHRDHRFRWSWSPVGAKRRFFSSLLQSSQSPEV